MFYTSTRDNSIKLTASEAVLKGLSDDGGLFVPSEIPSLSKSLKEISEMDYKETAYTKLTMPNLTPKKLPPSLKRKGFTILNYSMARP